MNTFERMQDRIREALTPPVAVGEPEARPYEEINRRLAPYAKQSAAGVGSVEEIFPLENRRNQQDFIFGHIDTKAEGARLIADLAARANPSEHWYYDKWLQNGLEHGMTAITVRRERDKTVAGYAIVSAYFDYSVVGDEDDGPELYLMVRLDSVYLSPESRGKGYSQALSWAAGTHVDRIIRAFSQMPEKDREGINPDALEVFLSGEAHSAGGARFLQRTSQEIESNIEMMDPNRWWVEAVRFTDDIDFSDYPDCGFGKKHKSTKPTSAPRR